MVICTGVCKSVCNTYYNHYATAVYCASLRLPAISYLQNTKVPWHRTDQLPKTCINLSLPAISFLCKTQSKVPWHRTDFQNCVLPLFRISHHQCFSTPVVQDSPSPVFFTLISYTNQKTWPKLSETTRENKTWTTKKL